MVASILLFVGKCATNGCCRYIAISLLAFVVGNSLDKKFQEIIVSIENTLLFVHICLILSAQKFKDIHFFFFRPDPNMHDLLQAVLYNKQPSMWLTFLHLHFPKKANPVSPSRPSFFHCLSSLSVLLLFRHPTFFPSSFSYHKLSPLVISSSSGCVKLVYYNNTPLLFRPFGSQTEGILQHKQ